MLDPAVGMLIVAAFALLFASAALHKLRGLGQFADILRAYRVLPGGAVGIAWVVPLLEAAVAAGLLPMQSRAAAVLAGVALLALYAGAIALNLGRGRRDLACGCGGPDEERPIAPWMVWRNLLLALLLAVALLPWRLRPLAATDALTVAAGAAVGALLYMSLDRLLGRVAPRGALLRGSR